MHSSTHLLIGSITIYLSITMCQALSWVQENIDKQNIVFHGAYCSLGETESNKAITHL
jgi:hypothetical protein